MSPDTIIGIFVGFFLGLLGSVCVARWDRYRVSMDNICRLVYTFNKVVSKCSSDMEIIDTPKRAFEDHLLELAIQGQWHACEQVEAVAKELRGFIAKANAEANAASDTDELLSIYRGDRRKLWKARFSGLHEKSRQELVDTLTKLYPEWAPILGGFRFARWFILNRMRYRRFQEYLDGKREYWWDTDTT